jgi:glycosyltransferase involved in cell wall biosynthesis
MSIGRLAPQKGYIHLIDAVASCDEDLPPCRFFIAGEGPDLQMLKTRIAKYGLDSRFSLLGFRRDVAELNTAADLIVQPSLWEGLSISLLEAMSLGRPVLTTTINSNLEVVKDSGAAVLVPPADPRALAGEIVALLRDHKRRERISRLALDCYQAHYSSKRMLDSYMALYTEFDS